MGVRRNKRINESATRDIDEYIAGFPTEIQEILQRLRKTIQEAAPQVEETISYRIPTFRFEGNLVHFAAFKHHIGFYPIPIGIEKFKEELSPYKYAKGSVQFPLDQSIPNELVRKIVAFRVQENLEKAVAKKKKRK